MEKLKQIKKWVIEQVLWAQVALKDKTGREKKEAVISKLDELIKLPFYLEWVDDILISYFVDKACATLNKQFGHHFENTNITNETKDNIADQLTGIFASRLSELENTEKGDGKTC